MKTQSDSVGHPIFSLAATLLMTTLAACGGGGGSSNSGSPTSPTDGGTPTVTTTITIGAGGALPANIQVSVGQRVGFVNNSGRILQISSDPHPSHTDCPQINETGTLTSGQTGLTGAFTAVRTCGFHDHNDPDNASFRGSIVIR